MHGLDLFEALLDGGLALVGIEDLAGGKVAIVGQQRVLRRVPDHAASAYIPTVQPGGALLWGLV